eukprot:TRINITY_DN71_c0_g1_i2.p1 TRINITY_DN71_c0_g1~~TRINITY_DN71_c0_g1_i2.p1  ORF type:complete len:1380 (-),score=255.02 TRINITY_DN71_c0_g1_i2:202-4341(-)
MVYEKSASGKSLNGGETVFDVITGTSNETLLQRIRARMDSVGLEIQPVEVVYENLQVTGNVVVGDRSLPSLPNTAMNVVEDIVTDVMKLVGVHRSNKQTLPILRNLNGVIKPGRLTLLLGPPGSGKSTFLKALAGQLPSTSTLTVTGDVKYNNVPFHQFVPQRTSAYIAQNDVHLADMTVRETLDFSNRLQGVGNRAAILKELESREAAQGVAPDRAVKAFMENSVLEGASTTVNTELTLALLGLDVCADTIIGNALKRGISGGQKRRVATGDQIVSQKLTLFMDDISTGLDSATTFQIVQNMQNLCRLMQATIVIGLLQPTPETFDLFDDVLLLCDGTVVYHGPRTDALRFFEDRGFALPPRKPVADFLQEVTSRKDQGKYIADQRALRSYIPVFSFAKGFEESERGLRLKDDVRNPSTETGKRISPLLQKKLGVPLMVTLIACFEREWVLMTRNRVFYIASTIQVVIFAVVLGTLFFRTTLSQTLSDGNLYFGAMFFLIMQNMFNSLAELTFMIERIPVNFKQRDQLLYPPWCLVIPQWILSIPFSLWISTIQCGVVYFLIGFAPEPARFFKFLLIFFLLHQQSTALCRMLGAIGRSQVIANTFGGFVVLTIILLGGFIISRPMIKSYWIWAYWASPLSYVIRNVAQNEFMAARWQSVVAPPSTLWPANTSLGNAIMIARGIHLDPAWFWIDVGALVGFTVLFNIAIMLALTFLKPLATSQPTVTMEQLTEDAASASGHGLDELSRVSKERASLRRESSLTSDPDAVGMVLPFQPLSLTFEDMSYLVPRPKEMAGDDPKLQLLHSVSGSFRPGVLTALMGVSGAGKTTLMDVLAGRKTGGWIEGTVCVSGFPKKQETFARVAGYVEQFDIHSPQLTVRESLEFSAALRLPDTVSPATRKAFVEEVMDLVELTALQVALVGVPGTSGLSTEQRKRLTIAVELVANPSIIFMDEPTSGLDARAAAVVMRVVRNTVDTGRTVVCTIHQPSLDIFDSFDELLLMKRGGHVIFNGAIGHEASELIAYFESIPGVPKCTAGKNPAAWMLEVSSQAAADALEVDFAAIYREHALHKRTKQVIADACIRPEGAVDLSFTSVYSRTTMAQFQMCCWKWSRIYWRSPEYGLVKWLYAFVVGFIVGSVYWKFGASRSSEAEVVSIMGALYFAVLLLGWNNAATIFPVVFTERPPFYRERAAGMYSPLPYTLAQVVLEIPFLLIQTIIYSVITYSLIQFEWTATKFLFYVLFQFLTFAYYSFYGMMAMAISPTPPLALVMSALFFSFWNLFSGFLITRPSMPSWWQWYSWINPVAWSLNGLITSQLGDVTSPITVTGLTQPVALNTFLSEFFGFHHSWLGGITAVLVAFVVFFWLIYAYALRTLVLQSR